MLDGKFAQFPEHALVPTQAKLKQLLDGGTERND
jgi:hypothetical protein